MTISIADLIERLGGAEVAANLTGVSHDAIRKWRAVGAIPSRHWSAIMQATGLPMTEMPRAAIDGEAPLGATAALVLADGSVFWGRGFGAQTLSAPSELCFSTGMTGYQETLTDPSFARQIITFTFPHIGNVGTNNDDMEAASIAATGLVVKEDPTAPSNYRATATLDQWLLRMGIPGIAGVDTRALTLRIRELGAPNAVLAYPADQKFDISALAATAAAWGGLEGLDLAAEVSCTQSYEWTGGTWRWETGFATPTARHTVVAVDYGAKRNILRSLASAGCRVIVVPAQATADDILRHQRPWRPGRDRGLCGTGNPGRDGSRRADFRHLPRPSAAGAGAGGENLQAGQRTPWCQSAGQGPGHRAGRDHLAKSWLCGG
jgi:carbamoyl-phosphate synthase small subunit